MQSFNSADVEIKIDIYSVLSFCGSIYQESSTKNIYLTIDRIEEDVSILEFEHDFLDCESNALGETSLSTGYRPIIAQDLLSPTPRCSASAFVIDLDYGIFLIKNTY